MGVDAVVERVRVVAQVGAHAVRENAAVAPVGSPETVKATACTLSESRAAVIALETAAPWAIDWLPPLVKAKSKRGGGATAINIQSQHVVLLTPPPVPVTMIV